MTDIHTIFPPLPLKKFTRLCIEAMNKSAGSHEQQVVVVFRRGRLVLFLTTEAVVADHPEDMVMDVDYTWKHKE